MRLFLRILSFPLRLPGYFYSRMRRARRLKVTREGRYFLAITLGVGLAAINTGNNLLYLLLGWLMSVIVASGVLSDICLRGIRLSRTRPKRIFANRPFLVEIEAHTKKRLASYSLEVEDLCAGKPVDKRCYFLKIPEGKSQRTAYRHTIPRRGLYPFTGFRISTKFPFGLFAKSRLSNTETEFLVYPELHPVKLPPPTGQRSGDNMTHKIGRRGEFFGLREYREGDDRRSIHWRSSARSDSLMVREYEDESQRRMTLVVDNALPRAHSDADEDALENAISHCASLAKAYLERGYALRLVGRGLLVPHGVGDMHAEKVLRALALLATATIDDEFSAQVPAYEESFSCVPKGLSFEEKSSSTAVEKR